MQRIHYFVLHETVEPYIRQLLETKEQLVESILKGVSPMEPNLVTLVVQNPGEQAEVIARDYGLTPGTAIEQYGGQIKHGAFVSLSGDGVQLLVADREVDGILYLQNNEHLIDGQGADIDLIGSVVASGDVPCEPDEADLETFTVYGVNDNHETFTAVVSATEDTIADVAVKAGTVDEGFEHLVKIVAILKGDQTDLESVEV